MRRQAVLAVLAMAAGLLVPGAGGGMEPAAPGRCASLLAQGGATPGGIDLDYHPHGMRQGGFAVVLRLPAEMLGAVPDPRPGLVLQVLGAGGAPLDEVVLLRRDAPRFGEMGRAEDRRAVFLAIFGIERSRAFAAALDGARGLRVALPEGRGLDLPLRRDRGAAQGCGAAAAPPG